MLNSSSVQDSRLAVDVDVQSGRNLSATGTLTVDGTLSLFSRGFGQGGNTLLQFQGDGVIEGSGTVAHGTNQLNNHIQTTSGTLTIGPDVTVRGFGGTLGTATTSFVNHGRIEAQSSNNFFRVMGDGWTNLGTIEADGGRLRLDGTWSNEGVIRAVGNDAELMRIVTSALALVPVSAVAKANVAAARPERPVRRLRIEFFPNMIPPTVYLCYSDIGLMRRTIYL